MGQDARELFVTGFGPFGGAETNPTEALVQSLAADAEWLRANRVADARVLRVAAADADEYIAFLQSRVREAIGASIVHFGFNANAKTILLERFCYNLADFRMADERGLLLQDRPIDASIAPRAAIESRAGVGDLCAALSSRFPCEESTDPGAFLCNYVYFRSSALFRGCVGAARHGLHPQDRVRSLFVHVPPPECVGPAELFAFARELCQRL